MGIKFVGVRKDETGMITHFLTNEDEVITYAEAEALVQEGKVDSLTDIDPDGSWEVDLPTSKTEGDNLGKLPEI